MPCSAARLTASPRRPAPRAAFLREIERWRELLARNIAALNETLSQRQLNYAVQMTIDWLIFLRICEDRAIEPYGGLLGTTNGGRIYPRLLERFRDADARYNSGLFHLESQRGRVGHDALTPTLTIPDEPLRAIIGAMYYPESPYEFSVLPVEILGQVYEQFLGKVIRLEGGAAVVEEKPEVRKAGGVYYTPAYIVDYIVTQTVGRLLAGKTPKQAATLRIVDPACGSGSFLLGAYRLLLAWHLDWYVADGAIRHKKELYRAADGEWRLTTAERRRILLNNLYGVDIDAQAVEVTRLSLCLKMLEGETEQSLGQLSFLKERALPDLDGNIKCGNALIGPDVYAGAQLSFLDEETQYRINAFDWHAEFAPIFAAGGFDAVIGNPPYIRIQTMKEWAPVEVEEYKRRYRSASQGNYDIYVVFVERGLQLLNPNGRLGYILPHKFFNAQYGAPLRGLIAEGKHLAEVVHFGDQQVFKGATTYTCLLFLSKEEHGSFDFLQVDNILRWANNREARSSHISHNKILSTPWNINLDSDEVVFQKIKGNNPTLDKLSSMFVGLQTSADTVFLFKDSSISSEILTKVYSKESKKFVEIETSLLMPVIRSGSIGRYHANATALVLFPYQNDNDRIILIPQNEMQTKFPNA